jgi:uncharacterized protein
MDKLVIGPSRIEGLGMVARDNIAMGETILFFEGEEINLDEMLRRVGALTLAPSDPLGIDEELYLDLVEPYVRINHSCEPNAYIRGHRELVAMKDIDKGKEITFDYSTTMWENVQKIFDVGRTLWTCPCKCGSAKCRGVIDQFNALPVETQRFYIDNRYAPDFVILKFLLVRPKL